MQEDYICLKLYQWALCGSHLHAAKTGALATTFGSCRTRQKEKVEVAFTAAHLKLERYMQRLSINKSCLPKSLQLKYKRILTRLQVESVESLNYPQNYFSVLACRARLLEI
jgi:hypothetical protein